MRFPQPTYANVMSTAAVFLALGGTSYAAIQITGANIKNSSITSVDIKDGSLLAKDFDKDELPAGPKGATGPQGLAGPSGAAGAAGATGATGAAGAVGAAGADGATGPAGPAGPQGETGERGPAGRSTGPDALEGPAAAIARLRLAGRVGDGPGGTYLVSAIDWSNTSEVGPSSAGGAAVGKPSFGTIKLTKPADSGSPGFQADLAGGQTIPSASLGFYAPQVDSPYATLSLVNVTVVGVTTHSDLTETVTLASQSDLKQPSPVLAFDEETDQPAADEPPAGTAQFAGISGASLIASEDWTLSNSADVTKSGAAAGKTTIGPFTIRKPIDGASTKLLAALKAGTTLASATVAIDGTTATTYLLENVRVTGYSLSGRRKALETVTLTASKITTTTKVEGKAVTRFCFDAVKNAKC